MQGTPNDPSWVDDDGTFHEWYTVEILLGETTLGAFKLDPGAHPEGRWRRNGVAFFCSYCGSVWGKIAFFHSDGSPTPYDVETVSCKAHKVPGWIHDASGSFTSNPTTNWLQKYFPPSALRHEFLACHEHYVKRSSHANNSLLPPPRPDHVPA